MRIFRGLDNFETFDGSAVTLGMFDGMHIGHQNILGLCVQEAQKRSVPAIAITFENHPRSILKHSQAPPILMTLEHRLLYFEAFGMDAVLALKFDEQFSKISARDFAQNIFQKKLGAKAVVLGFNARFGSGAEGDLNFLRGMCAETGMEVLTTEPVKVGGQLVSSTALRALLSKGDLEDAAKYLGRDPSLYGKVVQGSGRGKRIGAATANLDCGGELLPPFGVYAAWLKIDGNTFAGALNIGLRPTFAHETTGAPVPELHVIGHEGNLYGRTLEVFLRQKIRDEKKFDSAAELSAQIKRDIEQIREILKA